MADCFTPLWALSIYGIAGITLYRKHSVPIYFDRIFVDRNCLGIYRVGMTLTVEWFDGFKLATAIAVF
jgi:hypothetical protein